VVNHYEWNTADYLQILTPNDLRFIDGRIKTHGSGNTGWSQIAAGSAVSVLPGTIISHVNPSVSGYLNCDGTEVSRSTYSNLFAVMPNASSIYSLLLQQQWILDLLRAL